MMTVGVLIEVPEPFAAELSAARARSGDLDARWVPPHVTLVAPVSLDPGEMDAVEEHVGRVATTVQPFRMRLRGTGTFRPVTKVVFAAVAEGIPGCEQLERLLRTGPLAVERSYPYHPHVTVAHDVSEQALDDAFDSLAGYEAVFTVGDMTLFELHESGWRPRRRYRLGRPESTG